MVIFPIVIIVVVVSYVHFVVDSVVVFGIDVVVD